MEERMQLFRRRFPNSKITSYRLRKFFKEITLRKKCIRLDKLPKPADVQDQLLQRVDLANDVQMALERRFRIVQLDECMVTRRTLPTHAWSQKKTNIRLDARKLSNEVKAILAAVSREFGLDHIQVFNNSVTKAKFKIFLESLRRKYPFDDIMLVMDNLSVHKSTDVKERMEALGFLYSYTPAYSPAYNGIEEVFSIAKRTIKSARLNRLLAGLNEDLEGIIYNAIHEINIQNIAKCINRSLSLLNLHAL